MLILGRLVALEGMYCIYLRKSREDKELEKYNNTDTLDRHRKTLLEFAKHHNIEVGHIYEEIVSGETIAERKEMQKLLKDVENHKWSGVLVMEIERLARGDTADQGVVAKTFKYSSTKIITPMKTYNPNDEYDEEYFEFGLFMSRREYKTINRRLQRGRVSSVNEGKYVASIPPFGYKRKKLENGKGYTLEPDEEESKTVMQIFNLFAYQELPINSIAKTLDYIGLKPRNSYCWNISSIREILNNPVYIGKIRWNSRKQVITTNNGVQVKHRPRNKDSIIIDGLHPAIIDYSTWEIAQSKRKYNTPPVIHNNVIQNPLSGLVYCQKCKRAMKRRPYTSSLKEPTLICDNLQCDNISSKLCIVEDRIVEALKIWLKNYYIDYNNVTKFEKSSKIITDKEILSQLENKLSKERAKQNRIFDLFEEGVYNKDEFNKRLDNSKNNIGQTKERIKRLKDQIRLYTDNSIKKEDALPNLKNIMDIYYKLRTNQEKNTFLKTVIEKVTYLKTEKSIGKKSNPTKFEINIYPKLPNV